MMYSKNLYCFNKLLGIIIANFLSRYPPNVISFSVKLFVTTALAPIAILSATVMSPIILAPEPIKILFPSCGALILPPVAPIVTFS